jgi:benzoyl-CoA-dihydrodiol lyase
VQEDRGLAGDYVLKLNSYDLGRRHRARGRAAAPALHPPEVRCLVLTGALERVFCSGANIMMLRQSSARLQSELLQVHQRDAPVPRGRERALGPQAAARAQRHGERRRLRARRSPADRILLVDDRNSAVSFPRCRCSACCPAPAASRGSSTSARCAATAPTSSPPSPRAIKGKRAVEWGLVDELVPLSRFDEAVGRSARELAAA